MPPTLARMPPCTHATRLAGGVLLKAAFRGTTACPACEQALQLPPHVETAVLLVPLLVGAALSGRFHGWIAAVATLGAVFAVYLALQVLAGRVVPLRHVSAADAAATRYRVLIALMLAGGAAVLLGGVFAS